MKKKILIVNEASYLSTGFSVYGHELLSRLYQNDKYEIAEFAAYGEENPAERPATPWKFYPNVPSDPEELKAYEAKPSNAFGEWRFERVCLDFKPHIVWTFRDWWFDEFIERSPFRPYFRWATMPTVDSAPQDEQWIATYMNADAVYTYSEFGYETLAKEGGGLIKLQGIASPGANLEDFKFIEDKASCKKAVGLAEDAIIIGTVMRNQERKLYPDLIEAFSQFLKEAPKNIADKSFLYLHTSYPDVGWHLPRFIKEYQLANKVLFTYICRKCGHIFPSFYQDARTFCKRCKDYSAILPGVRGGLTRDSLGKIMNLFDVYVQYAVCEGFGMPLVEAACTGTVCMAVDYSAMADIIRKINGIPIKVQRMFYDPRTHSKRALPDNQDLVNKLIFTLQLSPAERLERVKFSRQAVEKHYNWDHTVKVWEDCFDRLEVIADQQSWGAPSRVSNPVMQMPEGLTNDEFVQWAIMNIAGRPELLSGYIPLRLTRDLNWGAHQAGPGGMWYNDASYGSVQVKWESYNRKDVIEELLRVNTQKNAWEEQRIASK